MDYSTREIQGGSKITLPRQRNNTLRSVRLYTCLLYYSIDYPLTILLLTTLKLMIAKFTLPHATQLDRGVESPRRCELAIKMFHNADAAFPCPPDKSNYDCYSAAFSG